MERGKYISRKETKNIKAFFFFLMEEHPKTIHKKVSIYKLKNKIRKLIQNKENSVTFSFFFLTCWHMLVS